MGQWSWKAWKMMPQLEKMDQSFRTAGHSNACVGGNCVLFSFISQCNDFVPCTYMKP